MASATFASCLYVAVGEEDVFWPSACWARLDFRHVEPVAAERCRARWRAPTSFARLHMRLVRSLPVGGLHWRPSTRKRVALAELS